MRIYDESPSALRKGAPLDLSWRVVLSGLHVTPTQRYHWGDEQCPAVVHLRNSSDANGHIRTAPEWTTVPFRLSVSDRRY